MLTTLESVIRTYVPLDAPNSRGFHPVLCKVCGDHGRKGKRAGFKFDQDTVGYNCFNCGHTAKYCSSTDADYSVNMKEVLNAFEVPAEEQGRVLLSGLTQGVHTDHHHRPDSTQLAIEPDELQLRPDFYQVREGTDDEWSNAAIEYLTDRGVDWKKHTWYCVRKTNRPDCKAWMGRLIIPMYKDGKLVFWTGRDLTDLHSRKYLSCPFPRNKVLTHFSNLRGSRDDPLYIVEGWFDAEAVDGVGVQGSKMTPEQIAWINTSPRPKVVVPDRFGDGYLLANQAIQLGWSISCPDIGDCKDVSAAVIKYGKLYVQHSLLENTASGVAAKVNVRVYCTDYKGE